MVERRGSAGTGLEPACVVDDAWSRETGEDGALTGVPRLHFRAAVKFNSKSNSNYSNFDHLKNGLPDLEFFLIKL
jgi:hypothetical protein